MVLAVVSFFRANFTEPLVDFANKNLIGSPYVANV
jgi:hypothetical protein